MLRFDATVVRKVLPTAAIAAAVIYGVHGSLIEPDAAVLDKVQGELQQARERHAESMRLQGAGGNLQAHVDDFKEHLADVKRRSQAATDQRELFERISLLAHEAGVELEQVRSLDWKPKTGTTGESVGQAAGSACTLTLSGSYASIASFVGKAELGLGFASITRLRMQPSSEGAGIDAELDLACFAPLMGTSSKAMASGGNP